MAIENIFNIADDSIKLTNDGRNNSSPFIIKFNNELLVFYSKDLNSGKVGTYSNISGLSLTINSTNITLSPNQYTAICINNNNVISKIESTDVLAGGFNYSVFNGLDILFMISTSVDSITYIDRIEPNGTYIFIKRNNNEYRLNSGKNPKVNIHNGLLRLAYERDDAFYLRIFDPNISSTYEYIPNNKVVSNNIIPDVPGYDQIEYKNNSVSNSVNSDITPHYFYNISTITYDNFKSGVTTYSNDEAISYNISNDIITRIYIPTSTYYSEIIGNSTLLFKDFNNVDRIYNIIPSTSPSPYIDAINVPNGNGILKIKVDQSKILGESYTTKDKHKSIVLFNNQNTTITPTDNVNYNFKSSTPSNTSKLSETNQQYQVVNPTTNDTLDLTFNSTLNYMSNKLSETNQQYQVVNPTTNDTLDLQMVMICPVKINKISETPII